MLCFCAQLDKERAAYNLKEGALSDVICLALNLDKHSEMRTRIKNWEDELERFRFRGDLRERGGRVHREEEQEEERGRRPG